MRKIRFLSLLLATVILTSSCGIIIINRKSADTDSGTDVSGDLTEYTYVTEDHGIVPETNGIEISQNNLDALENYDMNGTSVLMAVTSDIGDMFNAEKGKYASSVAIRNRMLAEKFGADIVTVMQSGSKLLDAVSKAKKSGDYYADFIVIPANSLGEYQKNGYLKNLRSLPYLDLDGECFNYDAMSQMTVGNSVYGAVGYANEYVDSYLCLYANKDILAESGKEIDYRAVFSEEFTWEQLFELLNGLPKNINTLCGSLSKNDSAVLSFFSSGINFVDTDDGYSLIEPDETLNHFVGEIKSFASLMKNSIKVNSVSDKGKEISSEIKNFDIFASGRSAFALGTLGDMEKLENCGFGWEVLPFPVYSEGNGYFTPVSYNAPVIAVLEKGTDVDRVGHILAALFAASEGYVRNSFLTDAERRLITRYTTINMIDLICENPVYDFAVMFGSQSSALSAATTGCVTSALKSSDPFSKLVHNKRNAAEKYLDGIR